MIQSGWFPQLGEGHEPVWQKLVAALAADIQRGAALPGSRLPPHRDLAFRLGIGVGTVSKAYVEAERAGLVTSHVGRGTFVAERQMPRPARTLQGPIDMARNIPPVAPALHRIGEALAGIRRRDDVGALVDYSPTAGLDSVRLAGAKWLQQRSDISRVRAERLIQTGGGQQALMLACSAYAKSGDTVLCDIATYPGNRTIAQHGGWSLRGVPADARGMEPEELDRAAAATGARLLILIPTLHNPTTITLDLSRRAEIVEVARSRDLLIIEDDIYRVFGAGTAPTPFAELAPERTVHIASLSKALAPGLRLAFILPPDNQDVADRLMLAQQATAYCPAAAGGLMFVQWMDDGLASVILEEVLAETERRTAMARDMIGEDMAEPHSSRSLHVWIPMNGERARRIASNAIKAGVEVTPPEAPFGEPGDVSGLRLCLGAATDLDQLEEALRVVRVALDDGSTQQRGIV